MTAPDRQTPDNGGFAAHVAYSARVNNFWQGGKDNFAADRAAGGQALAAFPQCTRSLRRRHRTAASSTLTTTPW
jgi:hypothetical protein